MRRGAWLALVLILLFGVAFSGSTTAAGSHRSDHRRYEQALTYTPPWQSFCSQHECGVPTIVEIDVTTPSDIASIDVVTTLSFDYRTTRSDWGQVLAFFREDGVGPATRMDPGAFPIRSPSRRHLTSTTLVWVKRGVPAGGRSYTFAVEVVPKDGDGDSNVAIRGRKLSFVIDMLGAGP